LKRKNDLNTIDDEYEDIIKNERSNYIKSEAYEKDSKPDIEDATKRLSPTENELEILKSSKVSDLTN
jgi:hypothetical protein